MALSPLLFSQFLIRHGKIPFSSTACLCNTNCIVYSQLIGFESGATVQGEPNYQGPADMVEAWAKARRSCEIPDGQLATPEQKVRVRAKFLLDCQQTKEANVDYFNNGIDGTLDNF